MNVLKNIINNIVHPQLPHLHCIVRLYSKKREREIVELVTPRECVETCSSWAFWQACFNRNYIILAWLESIVGQASTAWARIEMECWWCYQMYV